MTRTLMSTIMLMGLSATAVKAENSDATLSWDIYSTPDVLTKEVTRQVGSQVTFSDGVTLQVFARCRETGIGTKPIYYPGLALVFGAYRGANLSPLPYGWQNKTIQLPILVNGRRRTDVHGYTETLQANPSSATATGGAGGNSGPPINRFCTSARPTAWLAISDSNFDVPKENSSL